MDVATLHWLLLGVSGMGTIAMFLGSFVLHLLRDDIVNLRVTAEQNCKDIAWIKGKIGGA
jgi:hypothetical protein